MRMGMTTMAMGPGGGVGENQFLSQLFSTPKIGYSLRLIRSNYTGNCLKVRRSSDNGELDIGFVGGYLDIATLLTHCGAGDGFVTTWYDQLTSANLVQATANAQPKIVSGGVVLPHILFDSTDSLAIASLNIATPFQVNMVVQSSVGGLFITGSYSTNTLAWYETTLRYYIGDGQNFKAYSAAAINLDNKKVSAIFVKNSTTGTYIENNVLKIGSASTNVDAPLVQIYLGSFSIFPSNMQLAELVISGEESDNTAIYLNQKAYWGLV